MTLRHWIWIVALVGLLFVGCRKSEPTSASVRPAGAATPTAAASAASGERRIATFAGGCFWGMEELLRQQPGVVDTEVGYTGGTTSSPSYEDVTTGRTGHAEAVRVVYDPQQTSYEALLLLFFKMHDPTTIDRQGPDVGSQYRSAIFYHDAEQRELAERVKARVDRSGAWQRPVVTQVAPAGAFYPAEAYHQDYLQQHQHGYTCHFIRDKTF